MQNEVFTYSTIRRSLEIYELSICAIYNIAFTEHLPICIMILRNILMQWLSTIYRIERLCAKFNKAQLSQNDVRSFLFAFF